MGSLFDWSINLSFNYLKTYLYLLPAFTYLQKVCINVCFEPSVSLNHYITTQVLGLDVI